MMLVKIAWVAVDQTTNKVDWSTFTEVRPAVLPRTNGNWRWHCIKIERGVSDYNGR
jgi:hypothetical protein